MEDEFIAKFVLGCNIPPFFRAGLNTTLKCKVSDFPEEAKDNLAKLKFLIEKNYYECKCTIIDDSSRNSSFPLFVVVIPNWKKDGLTVNSVNFYLAHALDKDEAYVLVVSVVRKYARKRKKLAIAKVETRVEKKTEQLTLAFVS